jgi:hypothetical protein
MPDLLSNGTARRRDLIAVLSVIVLLLLGAEVATRRVAMPASQIERRVASELQRAANYSGERTLLFVGNSLLLYGIRDSVAPLLVPAAWRASRVTVEQTHFLDWKYGLKQFSRRGIRPAVIALMLDAGQLVGDGTRSDYSSLRLLAAQDVIPFGRDAGLHPTEISKLLLSHYSAFYGFRAESRKVLISRLMPGMQALTSLLVPKRTGAADTLRTRRVAESRLRELRDLAGASGARLIFLVPPRLGSYADDRAVVAAAADAGVEFIAPDVERPYAEAEFLDGYHLSAAGAERYETHVRDALAKMLAAKPPGR